MRPNSGCLKIQVRRAVTSTRRGSLPAKASKKPGVRCPPFVRRPFRTGQLDAIAQIGQRLTTGGGAQIETTLLGQPYSLTEPCEANLLHIAQEAMTNAVRHPHPHCQR